MADKLTGGWLVGRRSHLKQDVDFEDALLKAGCSIL